MTTLTHLASRVEKLEEELALLRSSQEDAVLSPADRRALLRARAELRAGTTKTLAELRRTHGW